MKTSAWPGILLWLCCVSVVTAAPADFEYRNTRYGFTLDFGQPAWKPIAFPRGVAAFKHPTAAMQIGIQVRTETAGRYQATVQNFKHLADTLPNLLQKPRSETGTSRRGHPISYIELIELNPDNQPTVLAISYLRLEDKGETVVTTFQGHLTVHDNRLDRAEINSQEADAHRICHSIDQL